MTEIPWVTPTWLLIGQITIVFALVLFGMWGTTEWAATKLAWQPELGSPVFTLGHWPIYRLWALFPWRYHFDAYAQSSIVSHNRNRKYDLDRIKTPGSGLVD
jgi:type IV secretory pathway TraG/TraD family ATPase VirD4